MSSLSQTNRDRTKPIIDAERFHGAMVFSAIGDALGWPTEFLREKYHIEPQFPLPIRDFVSWKKLVGGKWWGYKDYIGPGEYSDDTQLSLAIARCISSTGEFEPQRFAYTELPLWLHYQRGGGRSIKLAARSLLRTSSSWEHNFYKQGKLEYRRAGANGSAMRNLPIALASAGIEEKIVKYSFINALITHGHPRAILGTILFGLAVNYILTQSQHNITARTMVEYLTDRMINIQDLYSQDPTISKWIQKWNDLSIKESTLRFDSIFSRTQAEANDY
ncbi:unnamed protein product, partial [marine sediment metagenome]